METSTLRAITIVRINIIIILHGGSRDGILGDLPLRHFPRGVDCCRGALSSLFPLLSFAAPGANIFETSSRSQSKIVFIYPWIRTAYRARIKSRDTATIHTIH
jgi:hypothetical protein